MLPRGGNTGVKESLAKAPSDREFRLKDLRERRREVAGNKKRVIYSIRRGLTADVWRQGIDPS